MTLFFLLLVVLRTTSDFLRDWTLGGVALPNIVGALVIALFALTWPLSRKKTSLARWWLAFLLTCSVSLFFTFSAEAFASYAKILSIWAVLELSYAATCSSKDKLVFEKALLISAVVPVALGVWQVLYDQGVFSHNRATATEASIFGSFTGPNSFSFFLVYALLAWRLVGQAYWRWVYWGTSLLLLFLLYKTHTKLGWLAAMLVLLSTVPSKRLFVFGIVGLALASIAFSDAISMDYVPTRFQEDIAAYGEGRVDDVGSGRIGLWGINLRAYANSDPFEIIFGSGLESAYQNVEEASGYRAGAHSDFIRILVEAGLLAFLVWASIWRWLFTRFWSFAERYGISLLLAGTTIYAFDNSLTTASVSWAFWGLVGSELARGTLRQAETST